MGRRRFRHRCGLWSNIVIYTSSQTASAASSTSHRRRDKRTQTHIHTHIQTHAWRYMCTYFIIYKYPSVRCVCIYASVMLCCGWMYIIVCITYRVCAAEHKYIMRFGVRAHHTGTHRRNGLFDRECLATHTLCMCESGSIHKQVRPELGGWGEEYAEWYTYLQRIPGAPSGLGFSFMQYATVSCTITDGPCVTNMD